MFPEHSRCIESTTVDGCLFNVSVPKTWLYSYHTKLHLKALIFTLGESNHTIQRLRSKKNNILPYHSNSAILLG